MLYRVIDAVELPALVSAFMESYEVVAPVKRGGSHVFEVIQSPDDMDLSYATTISATKCCLTDSSSSSSKSNSCCIITLGMSTLFTYSVSS